MFNVRKSGLIVLLGILLFAWMTASLPASIVTESENVGVNTTSTEHHAAHQPSAPDFNLIGIPLEFLIFAATLAGVACFHHHVLPIAVGGMLIVVLSKFMFGLGFGSHGGSGLTGFAAHLSHEWVIIVDLFCLLIGFEILSHHFKASKIPDLLPKYLPNGFWGCFTLLGLVFVMSIFLDNIAAAMIGGNVAMTVFNKRVHVGYLAAIVAASNAGGAGSVLGDTTTTMLWISGRHPLEMVEAFIPAIVAFSIVATFGSWAQTQHQIIQADPANEVKIRWIYLVAVVLPLLCVMGTNLVMNTYYPEFTHLAPLVGIALWLGIIALSPWAHPHWGGVPEAIKGACFLLSLVLAASMMPVKELPDATVWTTMSLGFISAVFDNIPLTALAIKQGGYDWGFLAFAVGFGGSMIWFGSSSGVALSNNFPEAKSVFNWIRHGWFVPVSYVAGYLVMVFVVGWNPEHKIDEIKHNQKHVILTYT
jgi:Na+/H+ antiporter NhaD/arsenite permease-like protein